MTFKEFVSREQAALRWERYFNASKQYYEREAIRRHILWLMDEKRKAK